MKSAYPNTVAEPQAGNCAEASELEALCGRLFDILNFTNHQGDRIEGIETKLNGSRPETCSVGQSVPKAVPNGILGEMGDALDDIMSRLQRTDSFVSRLRSAI